jgi:hypothetical protein
MHHPASMNFPSISRLALLLAAGVPVAVGATDWQTLLGNSPFGQTAATATGTPGDLEFRGVVQEEGVYFVNLYNPATKTSQWIAVNGKVPGLEVQAYDAGADVVQVTQAGRSLTLPLKQARVALVAAAVAPAGAKGGNPVAPENPDDRRAQIRDMVRARLEGGGPGGEVATLMRALPPEAQAMIEEFRRRRATAAAGGGPGAEAPGQPVQDQNQAQRSRRDRP